MNSLWPATSRLSCLNTQCFFQTCHKFDSLAARLAQRSTRPYSISSIPYRQQDAKYMRSSALPSVLRNSQALFALPAGVRSLATGRVITRFAQVPKEYKDEDGLPFRATRLSKAETEAIFGRVVDVGTANRILSVLHGRRVAGTLGDPAFANPYSSSPYEPKAIETALRWLRKHVPVDEIECAGRRAEQELAEMEIDIVSDAERIGLYVPNSGKRDNFNGESGLDAIRMAKEAELDRREAEAKKVLSQADEIRHNTGTLQTIKPNSQVELRRPGENPWLKHYLERAKVLPDTPPELSKFQRLWPSGLLVLAVFGAAYVFLQVYTPPKSSARMFPDMPPSAATIIAIMLVNAIVLGAWRVPPAFRLLNKYFITVPGYPRALSVLGNVFSHQTVSHFGMNMLVLWFVGVRLHDEVGRANFLAIYLCTGVFGSFASLASWVFRNNFVSSSLGASGALCGIIACYLLLNSSEKVTFFGVFPPESWPSISSLGFLCFLGSIDLLGLKKGSKIVTVDHWAHLGGYASGAAAAALLRMRATRRKETEMERRKNLGFMDKIKEGRF